MSNLVFPKCGEAAVPVVEREQLDQVAVQEGLSGKEWRSTWWLAPKYRYRVGFQFLRSAAAYQELQQVASFYARHRGPLDSFLFTDEEDKAVTAHAFGVGDGGVTVFRLQRTLVRDVDLAAPASRAYWPAYSDGYEPVADLASAPIIYAAGAPLVAGLDYTVDSAGGVVTFTVAPATGVVLTWTGTYYWRVRFAQPNLSFERIVQGLWSGKQLELVTSKGDSTLVISALGVARTATDAGFAAGDGASTAFQLQATLVSLKADALGTWSNGTRPRTNLAWWSQAFDNAVWYKNTGVTVTADNVAAPDGTTTADRIVYDGSGTAGWRVYWAGGFPSVIGQTYTESVWLRADSTVSLNIGNTFGGSAVQPITVTTTWRRFFVTDTASATTPYKLWISASSNATFTIYAWGAQIEPGIVATQYIPTTNGTHTVLPAYWPGVGDGFNPVFDLRQAVAAELGRTYTPLNLAIAGDSITQLPSPIGGVTSWPALLNYSAGLGVRYSDWAVSGTQTSAMLTRFTAYRGNAYSHFVLLGGINDITNDVPLATIQANLTAMWSGARANGLSVVVMTLPPIMNDTAADWTAGRQANEDTLNAWIRLQAAANGYGLVDVYALLGDPAEPRQQLASLTSDGKHPNTAGQQIIADAVKAVLSPYNAPRYVGTPTITIDGDWQGKRILYSTPRTNLCTNSTLAVQAGQTGGTGSAPTISYNYGVAPDGTTTATRVQLNKGAGTTGNDYSLVKSSAGITTGSGDFTYSVWLKTNDGSTKLVMLDLTGGGNATYSVTGTWQRFALSANLPAGTTIPRVQLRGTYGTDTTADLLMWGAQVEAGTAPSQLIPTVLTTVTATDYTLSATGLVTLPAALPAGTWLSWTGGYYDRGVSP